MNIKVFHFGFVLSIIIQALFFKVAVSQPYSISVYNATASSTLGSGYGIGNAVDGKMTTNYGSAQSNFPVTMDFNFVDVARIDELVYYPPTYGKIKDASIWYSTAADPTAFSKLMDVDWGATSDIRHVTLNGTTGLLNPSVIRLVVTSGDAYGMAGCAEMQFFSSVAPSSAVVTDCDLGSNYPTIPADVKQTVASATASSFQSGYEIQNSFDGSTTTIYHSKWNVDQSPYTLDYNFSGVDQINKLVYTPSSGYNGRFGSTEIWYSTTAAPTTFTKICDYDFGQVGTVSTLLFPSPAINPATIRIIVKAGYGNYASCAEMEFYKTGSATLTIPSVFKDNICSGLKTGTTQSDIDAMDAGFYKNMAQCMLNGTYNTRFRIQSYEPYATRATLAAASKTSTGTYSYFENPTGIYFNAGDVAMVFCENLNGQSISLTVYEYDWTNANAENPAYIKTYPLTTGINEITITNKGLAYINYYTDNYALLGNIKIHVAGGLVNGYYDANTTPAEWKSMLVHAPSSFIDIKGQYVHLCYSVSALRQYSPLNGKDLIDLYDKIIKTEYEQMGLFKYNRVPKNHMHGWATEGDGVFAWHHSSMGVLFKTNTYSTCDPTIGKTDLWGIAHEFGHANQIRPGIKWGGTGEVTNNMYSTWVMYTLSPLSQYPTDINNRMEFSNNNDAYYDGTETGTGYGKGNVIKGGVFNAYLNNGVLKQNPWIFQYGALNMKTSGTEDWATIGGDFFVRLCPLWQLELYYQVVHPEKKDWLADVAEKVRNTNETGFSDATLQLNFVKNVCDAVGEDLTGFFEKAGMLRPVNRSFDDYGTHTMTITADDVAAVKAYVAAKGYKQPDSPVIYYLSQNSADAFKNHLKVTGVAGNGCTYTNVSSDLNGYQNYVTVDHSVWKNVAVFETYAGTELKRISMVGSGYTDNSKTRVYYPTGATAIYAVGYNGAKTLVYPAPITWTGTAVWNTPANWSTGTVPASGASIIVASGELTVDQNVNTADFIINPGANVTIVSGNTLTVTGNFQLLSNATVTASLINKGTLNVGGTTSAQSYLTGSKWHIVSPVAAGQSISSFVQNTGNAISAKDVSGTTNYGMMDYNETANQWNNYFTAATAGNLTTGKGYSLRNSSDGVVTYTGALVSGNQTTALTQGGEGWNCVGNPYPSAIAVNTAANGSGNFLKSNALDATNLDPSYACVYVWDQDAAVYRILGNSDYGTRNLGQNILQAGQGFFVKARNASSSIQYTPAMQVHAGSAVLKSSTIPWPGITLSVADGQKSASTVISFNSKMSTGLDVTYDAGLLRGSSGLDLYSRLVDDNGVDFAIQCLPEMYDKMVIPIGLDYSKGGEIRFSAIASGLPSTCNVILEDRENKLFIPLDGNASYLTTVASGVTAPGRFYLHTSKLTTNAQDLMQNGTFSLKAYPANERIWIIGEVGRDAKAYLFNASGCNLGTFNLQEGNTNSIPARQLVTGVYLLRVTEGGKCFNTKIFIY